MLESDKIKISDIVIGLQYPDLHPARVVKIFRPSCSEYDYLTIRFIHKNILMYRTLPIWRFKLYDNTK